MTSKIKAIRGDGEWALILSVLALVTSALGLMSQILITSNFGAGRALDEYYIYLSVPTFISTVFGGVFAYAMVPLLSADNENGGKEGRLASWLMRRVIPISSLFLIIGLTFVALPSLGSQTPPILEVLLPVWLAATFSIIGGATNSIAVAHGHSVQPQITSLATYGGIVAGSILGADFGIGALAWGLCVGTGIGVVISAAKTMKWWLASPSAKISNASLLPPAIVSITLTVSYSSFATIDAWLLPDTGSGSVVLAGLAQRLLVSTGTILIAGPANLLQPRLTRYGADGNPDAARNDLARAVRLMFLIATPFVATGLALRHQVTEFLFLRGQFTQADTERLASLLVWYLPGILPMLLGVIIGKAAFAFRDMRSALTLGIITPVTYIATTLLLRGSIGSTSAAIGYLLAWTASTLVVSRHMFRSSALLRPMLLMRIITASAMSGLAAYVVTEIATQIECGSVLFSQICPLVLGTITSAAVYVFLIRHEAVAEDATVITKRIVAKMLPK